MKRIFASTLALAIGTTGAIAGSHSTDGEMKAEGDMATETHMSDGTNAMPITEMDGAELIRTRDITGGDIYTMNEANDEGSAWDADTMYTEVGAEWNDIGEIEDLVLSKDGKIIGIVAEVGGFLDIGDKHVVIDVSDLKLVPVDNMTYAYVTRLNEEDLEAMEGVDEGYWN
ncbi:PRC-barrel domain-containing protein [Pseudoponticoccus marisrubri]|uniref:Photosystem reaction center subunit H n=1 Tax=Pseudoponticoccus marisrubri TaxID=1685382 RepID=A0A0W7WPL3_9RHOB|nr:PRC-barrel domain-containing protein [Pseudoponticoccus marisrubri]KUF12523.1 photosystem reaction center subunit H [Pseudoponticoccus marisrubri]